MAALAFVLCVGPVERFTNSRRLVSFLGKNPRENSSADRQRLGPTSKQGNMMMRRLLIEAAQTAARLVGRLVWMLRHEPKPNRAGGKAREKTNRRLHGEVLLDNADAVIDALHPAVNSPIPSNPPSQPGN